MAEIVVKKHVEAPPERVFELATDLENAAERVQGIKKMELLTEGPVGVGTRFRETRVMMGRDATEEMEITAFDPPRSYEVGAESHGCRYHSVIQFTPVGSGTEIEFTFQATPLTMAAKLMAVAFKPMMNTIVKCLEQDLDDLKAAAESESP
jgi:carbon monoxide dehydrogenase subunit G